MIKQLQGLHIAKDQLAFLKEAGLVTTKQVISGYSGKGKKRKPITKEVVDQSIDRNMLMADPLGFVNKYVKPLMHAGKLDIKSEDDAKKLASHMFGDPEEIANRMNLGLDPNKPADAAKMAQNALSTSTAVDTLATLILRGSELEQNLIRMSKIDPSIPKIREVTKDSVRGTVESMQTALQDVTGQAIVALAPMIQPAMGWATKQMSEMADEINKTGKVSWGTAGKAALGMLPIGLGASVQSMYDPSTRPLGTAAFGLNTAAIGLNEAAAALTAAAVAQELGGAGGFLKKAWDIGKWGLLGGLGAFKGLVGKGATAIGEYAPSFLEGATTTAEVVAELAPAVAVAVGAAVTAKSVIDGIADEKAAADRGDYGPHGTGPQDERKDLYQDLPHRPVTLTPTDLPSKKDIPPITIEKPDWINDVFKQREQMLPPSMTTPIPGPKADWSTFDQPKPQDELVSSVSMIGSSLEGSIYSLQAIPGSFNDAFSAGAMQIATSGSEAAAQLMAQAGGIGSIIGNAAAASLMAAASSISVNLNVNAPAAAGADTGSQKAAE
jgi:hypothetical protein